MAHAEQDQEKINYLMRYKWLSAEIEDDERRLASIDDRLYSVPAQRITDMPRGGQPVTIDALVASKMELQEHINAKRKKQIAIIRAIEAMPNERDRRILKLKFIDDLTHEEVAERINYSVMSARRFYKRALSHFSIIEQ